MLCLGWAFSEARLDWHWDTDEYQKMLKKSGGLNRINDFAIQRGIVVDAKQLHLRKTEIFDSMMAEEKISLRPGVANLINHALNNDIALATFQVLQYRSGALNPMKEITSLIREYDCLTVWDASHAAGSIRSFFISSTPS